MVSFIFLGPEPKELTYGVHFVILVKNSKMVNKSTEKLCEHVLVKVHLPTKCRKGRLISYGDIECVSYAKIHDRHCDDCVL